MSVSEDRFTEQGALHGHPGRPIIKDKWLVSGGDYVPKIKVWGAIINKSGSSEADITYKLRGDDSADTITLATNVPIALGDVTALTAATTTADAVYLLG